MNVEKVESLLERSRPAPPPPELRRRILEAAALKAPPVSASPRKPRFVEVMTMAASILMLVATFSWLLRETPSVPAGPQEAGQPFEERRLAEAFPEGAISGFSWSADGKHWACVSKLSEMSFCAVIDGKPEAEYGQVYPPVFGADGKYAYLANDPPQGLVLVLNGAVQKEFDTYSSVTWSPNGRRLAFIGVKDQKHYVVVDGQKSEPFGAVWELVWSPDGRTLAFSANIGLDWFCVVNGRKGEPFDGVQDLRFSPDGKTFAYSASEGSSMMVIGDRKGEEYESVGCPVFSADGTTFAYTATREERSFVVIGPRTRTPLGPFDALQEVGIPVFSRDGKVWAYRASPLGQNRQQVRIGRAKEVNGELQSQDTGGALYDSVGDPVVNSDGTRVAYAAGKGSRKYLVVDEKATLKFNLIDRISFGPDGKTVAFRAGQYGKHLVVVGEARSDEFDEVVSGPVWSSDGKRVAFTARTKSELWSRVLEVK